KDDSDCDVDGNACNGRERCRPGYGCRDLGQALCTEPRCVQVPAPAEGDDGNVCTQTDTCQGGGCTGGKPMVCIPQDQCQDPGTCDPASGCVYPQKPAGTACDLDHDACTLDTCQATGCMPGPRMVCDDGIACTENTCTDGKCTFPSVGCE